MDGFIIKDAAHKASKIINRQSSIKITDQNLIRDFNEPNLSTKLIVFQSILNLIFPKLKIHFLYLFLGHVNVLHVSMAIDSITCLQFSFSVHLNLYFFLTMQNWMRTETCKKWRWLVRAVWIFYYDDVWYARYQGLLTDGLTEKDGGLFAGFE